MDRRDRWTDLSVDIARSLYFLDRNLRRMELLGRDDLCVKILNACAELEEIRVECSKLAGRGPQPASDEQLFDSSA